jgi:peptidoglycan/LPS O-acetylase OafA/YrhL
MTSPAGNAGRIVHLDALRAFCMLFGVLSHGATIGHDGEWLFWAIKETSDLFRMATFFVIAGLFTALIYVRRGPAGYVTGRVRLILVPLAVSLVLLAPVTNWLIHTWHNGPMSLSDYFLGGGWAAPSVGNDVWHLHFWFLFTLFFLALAAPVLVRLFSSDMVTRTADAAIARLGGASLWLLAVLFGATVIVLRAVNDQLAQPLIEGSRFAYIVQATLTYLPFFAFGILMYLNAAFFRLMHRIDLAGIAVFAVAYAALSLGYFDALPRAAERAAYWMARAGMILFIVAALIGLAERFLSRPSARLSFLVDAAFTFYLFHMTAIYLVAHLVGLATVNPYVIFAVIVIVVPAVVLWLHARAVAPSPLLRQLLNGRKTARTGEAAPAQGVAARA